MSYTPELSNSDIAYIAGPMTGHDDYNFPAFDEAERILKSLYGCSVVNPAEVDRAVCVNSIMDGRSQREMTEFFMDLNTATIKKCTSLVLLEGWEQSPGARHELSMADRLGLKLLAMDEFSGKPKLIEVVTPAETVAYRILMSRQSETVAT